MKRSTIALATTLALAVVQAQAARAEEPAAKPAAPASEADTLYAVGLAVHASLEAFDLTPAELEKVLAGLKDAAAGKPRFKLEADRQQAINALAQARLAAKGAKVNGPYLAKAAAEKGAVKTASGLVYIPLQEGKGAAPAASDKVKVHYTGKLVDGKVFDSSVQRGQPAEFPLNGVIPCWTEGVQKMKVGGKARLVCPSSIAYGDRGTGPIPPAATLDFEVELLDIVK